MEWVYGNVFEIVKTSKNVIQWEIQSFLWWLNTWPLQPYGANGFYMRIILILIPHQHVFSAKLVNISIDENLSDVRFCFIWLHSFRKYISVLQNLDKELEISLDFLWIFQLEWDI